MDKPTYLVVNGNYLLASEPVFKVNNRAFAYGDGVFETIRVMNGKPLGLSAHFARLMAGLEALKIEIPHYFNQERIEEHMLQLLEKNGISKGGRVRFSVYRNTGGFYSPEDHELSYALTAEPLPSNLFQLNDTGIAIDSFLDIKKSINKLANLKLTNAQLYILASIDAQERKLGEGLILNDAGNIIEGSTSNIFLVSNGVLYTPSLSDGCVAGTMRMQIINMALAKEIKVYECNITPQRLLSADEVFLTNAIVGVKWVARYRSKRYYHKMASSFIDWLNEKYFSSTMDLQES